MTQTISREHVEAIRDNAVSEEIRILACMALAALDREPVAVPDGWEPCSPEWIERNGQCSCSAAPRIAFGPIGNHYHPHMYHNPQQDVTVTNKMQIISRDQILADIAHAEDKATELCGACADDHRRLAGYMRMLLAAMAMNSEPVAVVCGLKEVRFIAGNHDHLSVGDYLFAGRNPAPVAVPDAVDYSDLDATSHDREVIEAIAQCKGWNACRAAMLNHSGDTADKVNSPVIPGGWIKCSERMPCTAYGVLVATPWASALGGYAMKWATYCPWHPDSNEEGWIIPGASWKPTHWMPLPAAPEQEV